MRKAHPYGVQGRRPVADRYTRAKKEKKIEAIRKWAKQKPAEEESWGKFFRDVLVMFLIFASIYYVIFSFFLANEVVSGPSMQPTFEDGDRLIAVRKFTPKRNDVVIIKAPAKAHDQAGAMYIKRVIGLPGDTVQSNNDVLYINGKRLLSHTLITNIRRPTTWLGPTTPATSR